MTEGREISGAPAIPLRRHRDPVRRDPPPADTGRFKVTNTSRDNYVFRSPSLRNVAITQPYFHSGKIWRLKEAVAIMGSAQLGIRLSDGEAEAVAAFLQTLTGRRPKVTHPILPPGTDGTPRPITN